MFKSQIRKISLAATLTALSVVLDILSKTIIPQGILFGVPYYSIPLVVGSFILGPFYGLAMGFISDFIGFYASASTFPFDIIFSLQAMMWGFIPWFITKKDSKILRFFIAITITHIVATFCSSLATFIYQYNIVSDFNQAFTYTLGTLTLRLYMIPINIIIISSTTYIINDRLKPLYDVFYNEN